MKSNPYPQARGLVTWGKPKDEVFHFLKEEGVSEKDAALAVDALFQERYNFIRYRGKRRMFHGLLIMIPCVAIISYILANGIDSQGETIHAPLHTEIKGIAGVVVLLLWGLKKVADGSTEFFRPSAIKGPITSVVS